MSGRMTIFKEPTRISVRRKEIEKWRKRDPIKRLEKHILKNKIASRTYLEEIGSQAEKEVLDAHCFARNSSFPRKEELSWYVYKTRALTYSLAINEAFHQMMSADESVILIGQGVKSPWYVGNTAQGLIKRFGEQRVIDTPVSENSMTGAAVGACIGGNAGCRGPSRVDFMLYAFDPIINEAANWFYMSGARHRFPLYSGVLLTGQESKPRKHSQALHAMFSHTPGLKVVMPATPYDAKGLMVAAIRMIPGGLRG